MINPGSWLGVLGGGQLGRMFAAAAQTYGYRVAVLDPDPNCPTASLADEHIVAAYDDEEAWAKLAARCVAVTTEFENVPAKALEYLARRCSVAPKAEHVASFQDRIREKTLLVSVGAEVAPYKVVRLAADLDGCEQLLPGILKSSRSGYDGKGQVRVKTSTELKEAFASFNGGACVLEKMMSLKAELSVVVARRKGGEIASYPTSENHHEAGILDFSVAPARISEELSAKAQALAQHIVMKLDYVGVLCVELFLLEGDALIVNEIAPRPHNSGHYTIDACTTSQFEQQLRVLIDAPLGDTHLIESAAMVNLLGDVWANGEPDWALVLGTANAKLHLYGKREARPGRKMGHFTCLSDNRREAPLELALRLKRELPKKA
ncbi:MAG TPA: 5-(carboxyamino)imidazole ribonucleotide synthase [Burkholderiales bacterium]|jgi:5-(carboxyamino)imidazole ribonucleotide synthase|nr:5-(carboxyamino)imidazole ribonucleotide synthase [Burkholderiales bacterium]